MRMATKKRAEKGKIFVKEGKLWSKNRRNLLELINGKLMSRAPHRCIKVSIVKTPRVTTMVNEDDKYHD